MKKISSILYKFLMAFCVLLTLGSLMGLPALNSIISTVLFGGCTFWLYKKIKSISAEIAREEAEKAPEREREEAERAAKLAKDEAGGIMTFLYPAIHATKSFSGSKVLSQIVYFISNKSVEQIQSLQAEAEALIEPIIKVDRAEFTSGILSKRIFNVELKTQYDVAADEVQMSFSILIVEEDTRQKFAVTREKVLGIA